MEISNSSEVLILDFDHTLFLSNSTEEYLESAYPKSICVFLLTLIDWLKPWAMFPGSNKRFVYRDVIRIVIISIIFPWTYFFYLARTKKLSDKYLNTEILSIIELKQWKKLVVASNGFDFIIKPLLKRCDIDFDLIISSRIYPSKNCIRKAGKKTYLESQLTSAELNNATLVTDNQDDKAMLDLVGDFQFYRWPDEKRTKAGSKTYIPFLYTHASKRGNKNHVLNVMIFQDFLISLLVYTFVNPFSVQIFGGLFLLLLSFWCIYEVGYFENDLHELKYESKHNNLDKLNYIEQAQNSRLEFSAWVWALGFAGIGIFVLQAPLCFEVNCLVSFSLDLLKWCSWLLIVRLLYRVYNYASVSLRQFFFPLLQLARLSGPVIFLATNFLGVFLITSQMASRWLGYLIYRGGGDENLVQKRIVRHVIFVTLVAGFAIVTQNPKVFISWQFSLMLLWSLLQGHLKSLITSIKGLPTAE